MATMKEGEKQCLVTEMKEEDNFHGTIKGPGVTLQTRRWQEDRQQDSRSLGGVVRGKVNNGGRGGGEK